MSSNIDKWDYKEAADRASVASSTEVALSILGSWAITAWGFIDFASHIDQTKLIAASTIGLLLFLGNGVANRLRANKLEREEGKLFRTKLHKRIHNLLSR